ncbi:SBBP repeat-containing protein [Methanobrevibacter sp.]
MAGSLYIEYSGVSQTVNCKTITIDSNGFIYVYFLICSIIRIIIC